MYVAFIFKLINLDVLKQMMVYLLYVLSDVLFFCKG